MYNHLHLCGVCEHARHWVRYYTYAQDALVITAVNAVIQEHTGGRTLPYEHQWVVRAMLAMESRHRAIMRDEHLRRFRCELELSHLR